METNDQEIRIESEASNEIQNSTLKMADSMSFTDAEVRKKLKELGYGGIPQEKLKLFMQDLDDLIKYEMSKSSDGSLSVTDDASDDGDSFASEPIQYFAERTELPRGVPFSKSKVYEKENLGYGDKFGSRDNSPILSMSSLSTVDSNIDSSISSQVTRRKVARKRNGVTRVFDETHTEEESEASDITLLEERLQSLPIKSRNDEKYSDSVSETSSSAMKLERRQLPSYIRPSTAPSGQGRCKRFDPVNRYHQFKHEWSQQRVPGENRHDTLRWNVREQMLNCQVVERPQHLMKQNKYQVPTEKKRQALRWQVRCALSKI